MNKELFEVETEEEVRAHQAKFNWVIGEGKEMCSASEEEDTEDEEGSAKEAEEKQQAAKAGQFPQWIQMSNIWHCNKDYLH